MHYIIHCLDRPGLLQTRLATYDKHKAYLAQASIRIVISGPLVADDGETMIGSCFLVQAGSKDDVLAFHNADPFKAAGVWGQVHIAPFLKRVDTR
jgi:uncharacterized protein YciI